HAPGDIYIPHCATALLRKPERGHRVCSGCFTCVCHLTASPLLVTRSIRSRSMYPWPNTCTPTRRCHQIPDLARVDLPVGFHAAVPVRCGRRAQPVLLILVAGLAVVLDR
ncbi:unnamed protein product, partial [Ectocarpus sp. 13 AM-2016]